jgi:carboxyl-terminal processing protease
LNPQRYLNNRKCSGLKGIIIDVRNNAGGNINDLNFFTGHLIGSPLQFGYTRYKSGNGRLAHTPWISASILPQQGSKAINIPVIALADNYTVSLAEAVTMIIHTLPTGIVVGETTWGATGPITANKVYNDGSFSVPGFLSVTTSSAEFKYINDTIYEGKGFPPDINVPFNLPAINSGKDLQLEKAISLIH